MTREEAHKEFNSRNSWSQERSINAIYDYFEQEIKELKQALYEEANKACYEYHLHGGCLAGKREKENGR